MMIAQGIVSGGAAAYLRRKIDEACETKTQKTWEYVALQINHAALLPSLALKAMGTNLGPLRSFSHGWFLLTPFVMLASWGLQNRTLTPFETSLAKGLSTLNYTITLISSVALFALGSKPLAIASLSMLGLDLAIQSGRLSPQVKTAFSYLAGTAAALAFLGYADWIVSSRSPSLQNTLLLTTALYAFPRFVKWQDARQEVEGADVVDSRTSAWWHGSGYCGGGWTGGAGFGGGGGGGGGWGFSGFSPPPAFAVGR